MEYASIATKKCPFLAQLAKEHGEEFATSFAIAPTKPVGSEPLPTGTDAVCSLAESFRLFHGPQGVLPLSNNNVNRVSALDGSRSGAGCPFHQRPRAQETHSRMEQQLQAASTRAPSAGAPFATISLSNFGKGPNFGDFLRKQLNSGNKGSRRPPSSNNSKPSQQRSTHSSNAAGKPPHGPSSNATTGNSSGSNLKPQRPLGDPSSSGANTGGAGTGRGFSSTSSSSSGSKPPGAAGSSSSSSTLRSGYSSSGGPTNWSAPSPSSSGSGVSPSPFQQQRLGSSSSNNSSRSNGKEGRSGRSGSGSGDTKGGGSGALSSSSGAAPTGCPLRKWLGPAAGLVFNEYDKLVCPPAIVAARAALSKTAAVQQLRPQALPVKLVAVAAVVAGVNLPCGAVREHFEKFSVGWFVAVHATIPFVAMLRKAVIMPKYAMLVTIAAAVMGQVVGSRLERLRLQHEQQHGPLLTLPLQLQSPPGWMATTPAAAGAAAVQDAPRGAASQGGAAGQNRSSSSSSSSRPRGKHWRQKLAADPEPAADALSDTRCGAGIIGGGPGSLFARLPTTAVRA